MNNQDPTNSPTVDQERGLFGSAGWDATDQEEPDNGSEETPEIPDDIPRPDPDKDQG
jgi:hypothetical protein